MLKKSLRCVSVVLCQIPEGPKKLDGVGFQRLLEAQKTTKVTYPLLVAELSNNLFIRGQKSSPHVALCHELCDLTHCLLENVKILLSEGIVVAKGRIKDSLEYHH